MGMQSEGPAFERTSWLGILAALVPFLFIGLIKLGPLFLPAEVAYILLGAMIVLFLAGLARGAPQWCLPTAGFLASVFVLLTFSGWAHWLDYLSPLGYWFRVAFYNALPWSVLMVFTLIAIVVFACVKPLRPFYNRLRGDWTLFAFALYGSTAFWLMLTYDEYVGEEPYVLAASITLIGGALIYLRTQRPWPHFWILFASLTLALLIVTWSKWALVPNQTWPINITEATRWGEVRGTLGGGVCMMLSVLAVPALLNLIPHARRPVHPT